MKRQVAWLGVECLCAMLLFRAQGASAAVYVYDFEGAGWASEGPIVGTDSWAGYNGSIIMKNTGGPGSGWYPKAADWDTGAQPTVYRTNDANWSYSIPAGNPRIVLEMDVAGGFIGSGRYMRNMFGLAADGVEQLRFGGHADADDPAYRVQLQAEGGATYDIEYHHLKLVVDLLANNGSGSASLQVDGAAKAGLQDVDLGLTTAPATWNGLWVQLNASTRLDNLKITTTIEGDANVDGVVDISDFFILKTYFDKDPAVWAEGNFNDDSIVDIADFFILKEHFDQSNPEPATLGLFAAGACLPLLRRRRYLPANRR